MSPLSRKHCERIRRSRIGDTPIRDSVGNEGGSSSFLAEAFFSELRVITLKTKKYSTLKTTTTTDYPTSPPQIRRMTRTRSPHLRVAINFFLKTPYIYPNLLKKTAYHPWRGAKISTFLQDFQKSAQRSARFADHACRDLDTKTP